MFNPIINPFGVLSNPVPLLREAFPNWKIGNGIFDALEEVGEMPWDGLAESESLDLDYFGNHSGAKFVAPLVMHLIDRESLELLDTDRVVLAKIIWAKFEEPWRHLWETNVAAYNPIHNYNMTEERSLTRGDTEETEDTRNSVDTTDSERTSDGTDFIYGMNSDQEGDGRKDSRSESKEEGGNTSVNVSTSEAKRERGIEESETTNRSGNIGVTTTQAMLKSERELWMWNFFDQVYKDIDSVLSLPIYDACRV